MPKIRRKIIIKKDNTRFIQRNKNLNIYEIKTVDKKTQKDRTISVMTHIDLIREIESQKDLIELCFYVEEEVLNLFHWEVNDDDRLITNPVIKRVYSDKNQQTIIDKPIKTKAPSKTEINKLEIAEDQNSEGGFHHSRTEEISRQKNHSEDDFVKTTTTQKEKINNNSTQSAEKTNTNEPRAKINAIQRAKMSLRQENLEKRLEVLEQRFYDFLLMQKSNNTTSSSNGQIEELKDMFMSFFKKQHTKTENYSVSKPRTSEKENTRDVLKSRRNWKNKGFERIQTYFNIQKIELINTQKLNGQTIRTYVFKTKVWKKPRVITLKTSEKFHSNNNVNFYIKKELVEDSEWEITDFDNQITFFAHKTQIPSS